MGWQDAPLADDVEQKQPAWMSAPLAEDVSHETQKGLFGRIKDDVINRFEKAGEITADPNMSRVSQDIQGAGQVAATLGDTAGEVINSGYGTAKDVLGSILPDHKNYQPLIPDPFTALKQAGSSIANSTPGVVAQDLAHKAGGAYDQLSQSYPITTGDIEGAAQIFSNLLPVAQTAKMVPKAANTANYAFGSDIKATAADLKKASQASYEAAEAKGANSLPTEFSNSFVDKAQEHLPKDEAIKAAFGLSPSQELAKNFEVFRDSPMTLDRATAIDKQLGDFIHTTGTTDFKINPSGREALKIQSQLRQALDEFDGGQEYKNAIKDWRAQSHAADVERIINGSQYYDNAATNMKAGFRTIAKNPGRLAQYPKDVQEAIKKAASGSPVDWLRTTLGSRLISSATGAAAGASGGALGAVAGSVAGGLSSGAARSIAETAQLAKADKVLEAIGNNSTLGKARAPFIKSQAIKDAMKLPPAQAREALNKLRAAGK